MSPLRENQLKILLSDEELDWLGELAEAKGLDKSNYIRALIREQHEQSGDIAAPLAAMLKNLERLGGADHPKVKQLRANVAKLRQRTKKK